MKVTRCDFVHGLKCEQVSRLITELEGKIDSLREQLHTSLDDNHWLNEQNDQLRELVRWMYDRMDESCAVQYPYAPAPISYDRLMQAQARARELRVEVL